ncbi:hypothetical protein CAEBREN_02062 [Caenorhabditis brenneri]|uniref:Uncharacterized protein n=1 Tax=Caenorhabditis brenneri TaxID=135651 RepID=G0NQP5_CAEBE|nr:hypothetical protein CAEBREN_02062 [Caenorhabditis brenneri]
MNGNSNYRFKHCCHPSNTLVPIQPMAPPMPYPPVLPLLTPPPPPPPLYPFNQHHFNNGYYWKNGYSYPGVNQQLMTNQENVVWQQRANDGIIKNENKKLKEKDRQIEELLAKVASLEKMAQENAELRAKLHEFGDMEVKKQDLELREFNLEISELKRAEADSLMEQLEESEKCRMKAEEMVRMWESCYYHDVEKILKQNEDKLQAQRASDETFWKRQLDQMARKHEEDKTENDVVYIEK